MRILKIIIVSCGVLMLSACMPTEKYKVRSFVLGYYDIDRIELYLGNNDKPRIYVYYVPSTTFGYPFTRVNFQAEDEYKAIYDALCVKHNDMSYNRTVEIITPGDITRYYLATDFVSINVESDRDYDETHPAGTPLDDIVRFMSLSIKKYIDSGYKDIYDWDLREGVSDTYLEYTSGISYGSLPLYKFTHPVDRMLPDIEPGDISLLGSGSGIYSSGSIGALHFESLPTLSREHTFTVTLTADDGRIFTGTVDKTFE